jgi:predicted XRE-type DNA-binding protein
MTLDNFETSKPIQGYEGIYSITNLGRVWSHRRNKWIKHWISDKGYPQVNLYNNTFQYRPKLHRLVAEAFIPNTGNKPQVNHLNGVKTDCRVSNLEWCTARENIQHAADMGLNKIFRLSLEDKIVISVLYCRLNIKQQDLAEMFDVSQPNICHTIKTNKQLLRPDNYNASISQG